MPIPPISTVSPYNDDRVGGSGADNEYYVAYSYQTNYGRSVMPVAGAVQSKTPPACVDLTEPYTVLTVEWSVERIGGQPELPAIDTGDENDTILESVVRPFHPPLMTETPVWKIEGYYVYLLAKVYYPGDPLPSVGVNPANKRTTEQNKLGQNLWKPVLKLGKKSNNFDNGFLSGGGNSQG